MSTIGMIVLVLIGSAVLIGLGTLIYYLIYRHIINKRIEKGVTHKKGLMSPIWMPVILIGLQFLFGNPLLMLIAFSAAVTLNAVTDTETVETHVSMEAAFYSEEEMQEGYLSVYSMEENEGYTKQQAESGSLRFTCFAAENLSESWHPHYLLYTEVTEDYPTDTMFLFEITMLEDGVPIEGISTVAYLKEMPVCTISAMQEHGEMMLYDYTLEITCTILQAGAQETLDAYFMEEQAIPQEYVLETCEVTFDLNS